MSGVGEVKGTNEGLVENIKYNENIHGKDFIEVIKLSVDQQKIFIKELSYMGINAGSLFPGFDGICKGLKEKDFV